MKKVHLFIVMALVVGVGFMSACKGSTNSKATADSEAVVDYMAQLSMESERSINEKFIPYFSIVDGKYELNLTMEDAAKLGIDSLHYAPVRATVDTFNLWIEKYRVAPKQVMKGGVVKVLSENGDSLSLSLIGMKEIEEMKAR